MPGMSLRQRRTARQGSISVVLERSTGEQFVPMISGGAVNPGELVRFKATGLSFFGYSPDFNLYNLDTGKEILSQEVSISPGGTAVLDIQAPSDEARYAVFVQQTGQQARFDFIVSKDAPEPPKPPPKPDPFKPFITLGIIAVVLIGVITVRGVLR